MTEKSLDTALNEVQGIELRDLRSQIQAALPGLAGLPSLNLLLRTIETMLSRVENDVRQDVAKEKEEKEKEKEAEVKVAIQEQEKAAAEAQAKKAVSEFRSENASLITMVTSPQRFETIEHIQSAEQLLASTSQIVLKNPVMLQPDQPTPIDNQEVVIVGKKLVEAAEKDPKIAEQIMKSPEAQKAVLVYSIEEKRNPEIAGKHSTELCHMDKTKFNSHKKTTNKDGHERRDDAVGLQYGHQNNELFAILQIETEKAKDRAQKLVQEAKEKAEKENHKDKDDDTKPLNPVSLPIKGEADKAKDGQKSEQKQHTRT